MSKDFRDYLDQLEKKGKLVRVRKEVDLCFDIAAGIRKTSDINGPALLFENIRGYPDWRVAGGVYATQNLMALALGLPLEADETQLMQRYLECSEKYIKPKLVPTGPVKEIIIKGEDVDLTKLPIPTYSEKDLGPYLTAGVEIARHPDTGRQNVSIHRRIILGRDRTGLAAPPYQHLGAMILAAETKGQGLGVATAIGVDPSLTVASQIKAPVGVDTTGIAGALRGEPLEVVKCETIDVEVPANAEMVIEGVTIPGERVVDGPFGEYPGNYISLSRELGLQAWVVKVTAITMRRAPIFQAMLTGMPITENHCLKKWALAAAAYREASLLAEVKAVNLTGDMHTHVVVSIHKTIESQPRNIIYALLAARIKAIRIIVVDDDINVFDPDEVEWAVATRVLPDKDILIIPPVSPGMGELTGSDRLSARWGIDATMPLKDRDWYKRVYVPGVEKVDYI